MSEADKLAMIVAEWVVKAEDDLKIAVHTLKLGPKCPTEAVAFHAQQCVEKYIKALLIAIHKDFPKIHNIRRLVEMLPAANRPSLSILEQDMLTPYATEARSPGDYAPMSLAEARRAVAMARHVRKEIRTMLPTAVLRTRRM